MKTKYLLLTKNMSISFNYASKEKFFKELQQGLDNKSMQRK